MANLFKNLGNAVSGLVSTAVVVTDSLGKVVTSASNSTVNVIDGTGVSVNNLVSVSSNFTQELSDDSELSLKKNQLVNDARSKALIKVLKDETVLLKLEEAETDKLLTDIFEDYDIQQS